MQLHPGVWSAGRPRRASAGISLCFMWPLIHWQAGLDYLHVLAGLQEREEACKISFDLGRDLTNCYAHHVPSAKARYEAVTDLERKEIESTTVCEWLHTHIMKRKDRGLCTRSIMEDIQKLKLSS